MQISECIRQGVLNTLKVDRLTDHGAFLVSANGEEVLLPNRYVVDSMRLGSEIEVFVATDSEDRLVALTDRPIAMRGEFGYFKVVDSAPFGAFVDWGLPKDLFVPKSAQKRAFKVGESKVLMVAYDKETDRLYGDEHVGRYFSKELPTFEKHDEVSLLVLAKTPLGFKVIVDNRYEGMIYHNEIFEPVKVGEKRRGYFKCTRDDDKLDISLTPMGRQKKEASAEKVFELLKKSGGQMAFTYKSTPEDIQKVFGLSRKSFKLALTELLEAKLITLDESGIKLA